MSVRILIGDCRDRLAELPDASAHCCVTSPPYFGLRDYGVDGQMGLEPTPDEFVAGMVEVFREVRRVLRDDGTLWLNLGDSYNNRSRVRPSSHQPGTNSILDASWASVAARQGCRMSTSAGGLKEKDLFAIPWMTALALRADGWYLRQDIIWAKKGGMPESVTDRCTKSHEYIFLLGKSKNYYFDAEAIAEPAVGGKETRNRRSVWHVGTQPFSEAHFATYPPELVEPCILAGCPKGGIVLDPFGGAGTTGLVADRLGRNAILIELNPEYAEIARKRLTGDGGMFADVKVAA